jgi:hypothetical protein
MLGIVYRAYKQLSTTYEERASKASLLRGSGKFLEAERLEDPEHRLAKVTGGILYTGLMAVADFAGLDITENDARLRYIINKLQEIDRAPDDYALHILNCNKLIKMLLMHPPFKENVKSNVLYALKVNHEELLRVLQIHVAQAYAWVLLERRALVSFAKPYYDPALLDIAVADIIAEGKLAGAELEAALNRARDRRGELLNIVNLIDGFDKDVNECLLPWPTKGPLSWVSPEFLYMAGMVDYRPFDGEWIDPSESSKIYSNAFSEFSSFCSDLVESIISCDSYDFDKGDSSGLFELTSWFVKFADLGWLDYSSDVVETVRQMAVSMASKPSQLNSLA